MPDLIPQPRSLGRFILVVGVATAIATSLGACATIAGGGKTQDVRFDSTPAGATVLVDGEDVGVTPTSASLARKESAVVQITLAGYETHEVLLDKSINGWFWANILLGGLIGMAVDAVTGAMYKLSPDEIAAQLAAGGSASVQLQENGLYVFVVLTPDASWTPIGQLGRE